jgi:ammonia channel protein AmtB
MLFCLILKKIRFDDAMENFPIYGTAAFFSAITSVFFMPDTGILWGYSGSGSALGIQMLGFTVVSFWTLVISWLYFFSLKRCKILRMRKAEEILG